MNQLAGKDTKIITNDKLRMMIFFLQAFEGLLDDFFY